jgi:membrane fusion protein, adhesin transport system
MSLTKLDPSIPFPRQTDRIARRTDGAFVLVVLASLTGFVGWASLTEIDKVARGGGKVIPQTQNQIVQHFEGGIVTDILVREGDIVTRGAPLLKIENTLSRSELEQSRVELGAKIVRSLRATAEILGDDSFGGLG